MKVKLKRICLKRIKPKTWCFIDEFGEWFKLPY